VLFLLITPKLFPCAVKNIADAADYFVAFLGIQRVLARFKGIMAVDNLNNF
jgi:hypothetical protein